MIQDETEVGLRDSWCYVEAERDRKSLGPTAKLPFKACNAKLPFKC